MTGSSRNLHKFFYPKSVAVIGASTDPRKTGHVMLNNLLTYGYEGSVYPINPGAAEILGVRCYGTIADVPGEIDLAVFTIPAMAVAKALEECGQKGIQAAVVHSAGFAESGEEGKQLQDHVVDIAKKHKVSIIGPNCMGIMCVETRVPWARRTTFPETSGGVAVISQSGGGGGSFVNLADDRGIRFGKIVTIGNECDVTVLDLVDYLGDDPKTSIIFLYLECFRDGYRFRDLAKKVSLKKPIIVYKIGRTDAGARAASSHTGSMAGSLEVYEGAFKQAGVIRAEGIAEALDYITAFEKVWFSQGKPSGNRVGIVTGPGGPGVATADACVESGLSVPMITEETKRKLLEAIPQATPSNPMDMADFGFVATLKERDPYGLMTKLMEEDETIDLTAIMGPGEANPSGFMEVILNIHKVHRKPYVVIWPSAGREVNVCKAKLIGEGVPLFITPEGAAKALGAMMRYERWLDQRGTPTSPGRSLPRREDIMRIVHACRQDDRKALTLHESIQVLSAFDIPTVRGSMAASQQEASATAKRLGFPVAMKIVSPQIIHKTDAGCVSLNVGREDVEECYDEIVANAKAYDSQARIDGVFVQEMSERGVEVIIGAFFDPTFGQTIMFGLGGIFVEVLKDVSFRLIPVDQVDVQEMIEEIRGYPLLMGARGMHPVDIEAIRNMLLGVSKLMGGIPEFAEMDLNPVIVSKKGAKVVDARIILA